LITIYTDHKNLTFSNFTTDRVTRWRLIVEEYGPKIVYLPGKRNIIADALLRLPKLKDPYDESTFLEEIFALNEQSDVFPIAFDITSKAQLADKKIQQCITNNDPDFEMRIIQRAPLVYFKGKIAIPTNLCFRILTWYHEQAPTECFIPSRSISLGPAYAHKSKTLSNIATLANITRHKEKSMDMYLFRTSNKSLIHGIQLQSTPLDPGSFRSRHTLLNQKSLRHFKHLQLLT
jgi:hypothetical protein